MSQTNTSSRKHHKREKTGSQKTLDIQHMTKLEKLDSIKNQIAEMQRKVAKLDDTISKLKKECSMLEDSDAKDKLMDKLIKATDDRYDLNLKVAELNRHNHIEYFLDTSYILYKYYDIIEKGGAGENIMKTKPTENSILNWFTNNPQTPVEEDNNNNNGCLGGGENKASLIEKYLQMTCENYISPNSAVEESCAWCGSSNVTLVPTEGCIICNSCSSIEHIILNHEKPSYKDPPKEISYWAYKRINHFNEWLNHVQARQSTDIPDEIYDKILLEIKKQRISNMAELTPEKVKDILKKLNGEARKYYEHIPFIIHRLNGMHMPHFSPELEEKLRSMFKEIQVPFSKAVMIVAPDRKNFLSYGFTLNKFMQLLGLDEYVHHFPLLRSREKLHIQDLIWKKICEELHWQYIPSM